MPTVNCPTCHGFVPLGSADDGDWLTCPHCESGVRAIRPAQMIRMVTAKTVAKPSHFRPLMILLGLGLVSVSICGLGGLLIHDQLINPDFQTFTVSDGRFSIDIPGNAYRAELKTFAFDGPPTLPVLMYERVLPDDTYMVMWIDVPPEVLELGPDAVLAEACDAVAQSSPTVMGETSRTAITVKGYPGYDIGTTMRRSTGQGLVRLVLANGRLYIAIVCGGMIDPETARARRFVESLKMW